MECLLSETNWLCLKSACKIAALAFIISLIVYCVTLAPAIPPGFDSAELISACAVGGIAHPPGYPLYTMLGWLLCSLKLAAPALTMNAFSALCSAAACACLAFGLSLTLNSAWGALVGAFCFAFALSPWRMAVGAEVFSLHLFFIGLLAALAVVYKKISVWRPYTLWVLSFVLGLSFSHHHTTALFLPGLAVFLYLSSQSCNSMAYARKAPKPKAEKCVGPSRCAVIGIACLCFTLGLLPYLWLIVRAQFLAAHTEPFVAFNWGNPSTWKNFFWVVMRSGYGSLQLSTKGNGASGAASLAYWLLSLFFKQFKLLAAGLGLWGIVVAWRKQRTEFWLWICLLVLAGPIWAVYAAQPDAEGYQEMMERFFCSSYLAFGAFAGFGAATLANLAAEQSSKLKQWFVFAVLVTTFIWPLASNWDGASERGQYLVNNTILYMAASIPDKAIVAAQNDAICGGLIYAKAILKRDFIILPVGVCHSQWFIDSLPLVYAQTLKEQGLAAVLDLAWREGRPVYFDDEQTAGQCGLEHVPFHYVVRQGLLFRYTNSEEKIYASEANLWQYRYQAQHELEQAVEQYNVDWQEKKARPFWHKFMLNKWKRAQEALDEKAKLSKIEEFCLRAEAANLD